MSLTLKLILHVALKLVLKSVLQFLPLLSTELARMKLSAKVPKAKSALGVQRVSHKAPASPTVSNRAKSVNRRTSSAQEV